MGGGGAGFEGGGGTTRVVVSSKELTPLDKVVYNDEGGGEEVMFDI
jgi:hypothetical protein